MSEEFSIRRSVLLLTASSARLRSVTSSSTSANSRTHPAWSLTGHTKPLSQREGPSPPVGAGSQGRGGVMTATPPALFSM
jgi:hypothetical protein